MWLKEQVTDVTDYVSDRTLKNERNKTGGRETRVKILQTELDTYCNTAVTKLTRLEEAFL